MAMIRNRFSRELGLVLDQAQVGQTLTSLLVAWSKGVLREAQWGAGEYYEKLYTGETQIIGP